jgi:hypothetical protein
MLTFWTVGAAFYLTSMLYDFFVRPSAGMAAIEPMRRAAPIAVLAVGGLLTLAFVPEPALRTLLVQMLTMLTSFWGTTIRGQARPYNPGRTSILGLSGADPRDARH